MKMITDSMSYTNTVGFGSPSLVDRAMISTSAADIDISSSVRKGDIDRRLSSGAAFPLANDRTQMLQRKFVYCFHVCWCLESEGVRMTGS